MIKGISIGNYYSGNSIIHKLDPRTKIIFGLGIIIALFLMNNYLILLWTTAIYSTLVFLAGLSIRYIFRGLKIIFIIAFIIFLVHLFITPGYAIAYLGPFSITKEGLDRGIIISLRLLLLIGVSVLLTATTPPLRLTDGLQSILAPLKKVKVPTSELALMVSIALRFIPTFVSETERIIKAQSSRGVDFYSGSIKERLENVIPILIPLFISSFKRAEDLATAMEARCYRGEEGRTKLYPLKYGTVDLVAFVALIVFVGVVVVLRAVA